MPDDLGAKRAALIKAKEDKEVRAGLVANV